ncbi:MAG: hypothetical protein WDM77_16365 [Steroidobacteraceae bacterium]
MLGELAFLDADDVGGDPCCWSTVTRKPAVRDHVVALGDDELVFIPECGGRGTDQFEKARPPWTDVGTVLDVAIGPESLGHRIVSLVEKGIEGFEYERLILLGGGLSHAVLLLIVERV